MKTIIVLISLLFSLPAAGYEVIFHQGFEGEQFPPEGWDVYNFWLLNPGHDSNSCVWAYITSREDHCHINSPAIELESGDVYTVRFYYQFEFSGWIDIWASFTLDDENVNYFDVFFNQTSYWEKAELTIEVPDTANSGRFHIYGYPHEFDAWFKLYLDDFSVIHTATGVTPTSFGHIKAAYR